MEVNSCSALIVMMNRHVANRSQDGNCKEARKFLRLFRLTCFSGVWAGQLGDGVSGKFDYCLLAHGVDHGIACNKSFRDYQPYDKYAI